MYGEFVLLLWSIYVVEGLDPSSPPPDGIHHKGSGSGIAVVMSVGYVLLFLGIAFCFFIVYCHKKKYFSVFDEEGLIHPDKRPEVDSTPDGLTEVVVDDNSDYKMSFNSVSSTQLVFFDKEGREPFKLDDLLRASAEGLGQSSFGNLYRVVMEDGTALAVKRSKELAVSGVEFERRMAQIGSLKHPNVLPMLAYYSSKEEKLFVYGYQKNGSLASLLQKHFKGPQPHTSVLGWNARLAIARGIAKGLAYLHQEFESQNIPHGNLKPSNVLLSENSEACISEYGFASLIDTRNPSSSHPNRWNGYKAPDKRITQKADVYSFGMMLLELLTGKPVDNSGFNLSRWVQSIIREEWTVEVFDRELRVGKRQKKLVALLQMALNCVSYTAENRPKMKDVAHSIDKLCDEEEESESPTSDSSVDSISRNSIPISGATATPPHD